MAIRLLEAATTNAFSTTLNGTISDSDTTITLTTTTGLQAPGVICIDRTDGNGSSTPSVREYITFTGISGNDLTGVTRGVAGSTAQSHNSGATVEENFSVTHWGDLIDFLQVAHDSSGNIVTTSTATMSTIRLITHLNASGASITGTFPIYPTWTFTAASSSVSAYVSNPLSMPTEGNLKWISVTLSRAASGASYIFDVNKNGSSIFATTLRPTVAGGGTFVSTASIETQAFNTGNIYWVDIDGMGGTDVRVTVQGGS